MALSDWTRYSGGLDTSPPLETGTHSVFTEYSDCSIMFHVSPYLPYSKFNNQQVYFVCYSEMISLLIFFFKLARKRHIGNDVVILIFNEAAQPYLASLIASQFNHVIIVVSPENDDEGRTFYTVAITAKEEVPTFCPPLPINGKFYSGATLQEFLLEKSKFY